MKVVDNGAGIEKENLEKVLDKFFQEDYNKAGSGLGLAISNEIVKLHGGKMILNSKKGVGTSITVKIKNNEKREERQNEKSTNGIFFLPAFQCGSAGQRCIANKQDNSK